ncbi:MAG: hypothetical protein LLG09_05805 [Negativicutes bacterium]|nr:hypothetical protein [Negativicutes bacterium]
MSEKGTGRQVADEALQRIGYAGTEPAVRLNPLGPPFDRQHIEVKLRCRHRCAAPAQNKNSAGWQGRQTGDLRKWKQNIHRLRRSKQKQLLVCILKRRDRMISGSVFFKERLLRNESGSAFGNSVPILPRALFHFLM